MDLDLQIHATAVESLDHCISLQFADDRGGMALVWLSRWQLHYLEQVPDMNVIGDDTVIVPVTVDDPVLQQLLQHYPGFSPTEVASAVVTAEGLHVAERKWRDPLIMQGRYDFDAQGLARERET